MTSEFCPAIADLGRINFPNGTSSPTSAVRPPASHTEFVLGLFSTTNLNCRLLNALNRRQTAAEEDQGGILNTGTGIS